MNDKLRILFIVGAGGFLGSGIRYFFSLFIHNRIPSIFPLGTLAVNIIGCLLIGIIFGLSEKSGLSSEWRLFLATGICGGFTTFSAFSVETFVMLRESQYLYATVYIGSSLFFGFLATIFGFILTGWFR
jgi:CrcB protein